ncbi:MAG: DNA gyrase inhibitor YacG [Proteobacteria bacterium]|nr:DNA gyrase inhibitor YacG [Pseudomonadota bacterium]
MPTQIACPTCKRLVDWSSNPYRPFCSERCRLIDLGAWLNGQRAIPGEPLGTDSPDESPPEES